MPPPPAPLSLSWTAYPSTNCWEGVGAHDLDGGGSLNGLGLAACKRACEELAECDAIVVGYGQCWRRYGVILDLCSTGDDAYDLYVLGLADER